MLPKLELPKYTTILPVSKNEVTYRPYTVNEEKLLLLAKESGNSTEILSATREQIKRCTGLNLDDLTIADAEWLFIQLRIKSVGEISELQYRCTREVDGKECNGTIVTSVDLRTIECDYPDVDTKVEFTNTGIGIKFNSPTYSATNKALARDSNDEIEFIYDCVDYVWDAKTVTSKSDITLDEFRVWIGDLEKTNYEKIKLFFENTPSLTKTLHVNCPKCGAKSDIVLSGLDDFFL